MMAEGIYGFLFLIGAVALFALSAAHVIESVNRAYERTPILHFLLLLLGVATVFLAFPRGSLLLFLLALGVLFFGQIPLAIFLLGGSDISRTIARKRREEAQIVRFSRMLEREPNSLYAALGLATTYERYGGYLKAAQEYNALAARLPEEMLGLKARLERKEKLARRRFEAEQKLRVFECENCKVKNRPQQKLCVACGQPLHRNAFQWLWRSVGKPLKFGALAVILISLIFTLALPLLYCLILALIWLTVIVYFSLLNGLVLSR
jgi:hypothetical protein